MMSIFAATQVNTDQQQRDDQHAYRLTAAESGSVKDSMTEPMLRESVQVSEKESMVRPSHASTLLVTVDQLGNNKYCGPRTQKVLGALMFLSIVLSLVFFYAIVPQIAQDSIDGSSLELGETNITNPTEDSITLDSIVTVRLDAPIPVTGKVLDSSLDFYFVDPDMGSLHVGTAHLPSVTVHPGTTKVVQTVRGAKIHVHDFDNWHQFVKHSTTDEFVTLRMKGTLKLRVTLLGNAEHGWQHFVNGITVDKKVTMAGLNSLAGAHFSYFDTITTTEDEYPQLVGTIIIDNPSDIAIMPVGRLTAEVRYDGELMSVVHSDDNITMHRGRQVLKVRGPACTTNVSKLSELVSNMLAGVGTDTLVIATNVTNPHADPHWPAGPEWGDYEPAVSVPLYSRGLQGVAAPFVCTYPGPPVNLTTESIVDVAARYVHPIYGTIVPLWFGINNPLSATMVLKRLNYVATYNGKLFGTITNSNMSLVIEPNAVMLSGFNLTDAAKVVAPTSPTSIDVFLQLESVHKGWTVVGAGGTFTLQIGYLELHLWNQQAQNIHCCALSYLQKSDAPEGGGKCSNPDASVIDGSGIWRPNVDDDEWEQVDDDKIVPFPPTPFRDDDGIIPFPHPPIPFGNDDDNGIFPFPFPPLPSSAEK